MTLTDFSLREEEKKSIGGLAECKVEGVLVNTNTVEEFNSANLEGLAENNLVLEVEGLLKSGNWMKNPCLINRFFILSFADLKSYLFRYQILTLHP